MAFPATRDDITAAVIAKARLDSTNDTTKVNSWIDSRYAELVLETEFLASSGTLSLTAGTSSYDLTSVATGGVGRIKTLAVTASGEVGPPLRLVSENKLIALRRGSGQQGTPTDYTLLGYKTLELFPTPATTQTLTVYYVGLPTALSGSTVPILGEPYGSKALEYAVLVDAAEFKSDPQLGYWSQQADLWKAKLLQHLDLRRGGQVRQMEFFPDADRPLHDPATIVSGGYW